MPVSYEKSIEKAILYFFGLQEYDCKREIENFVTESWKWKCKNFDSTFFGEGGLQIFFFHSPPPAYASPKSELLVGVDSGFGLFESSFEMSFSKFP